MNRDSDRNMRQTDRRNRAPEPEIRLDMLWTEDERRAGPAAYRDAGGEDDWEDDTGEEYDWEDDAADEDGWEDDYIEDEFEERRARRAVSDEFGERSSRRASSGKRRKRKRFHFKRLLLLLLLLVGAAAGFWLYTVNAVYDRVNYVSAGSGTDAIAETDGVVNILLIGNDSREDGDRGRSDAMLLLSINKKTGKIFLTSFLRDMYVEIAGHDNNRLNMAYSYGGAELLMDTLKRNFDIDVNRYVIVDFEAFSYLVDAAGGVDLELTNEEVIYVNGYLAEYNMLENRPAGTDYLDETLSGTLHLNGPQALAYCRNRYIGTDFARTGRQRKVLSALVKRAPAALLGHFGELVNRLPASLTTNLTREECMRLSLLLPGAAAFEIVQESVPVEGSYTDARINQMAVLQVDFEKNRRYIHQSIYEGETPEP